MKTIEDELLAAHQALMCLPVRLLRYGKLAEACMHIWNALEANNEASRYLVFGNAVAERVAAGGTRQDFDVDEQELALEWRVKVLKER